jgi:plastocyanin
MLAAGALALAASGSTSAQGIQMVSVDIVDVPRPQERWGYAPRIRRVPEGSWVTWSNAGQDAHTVTAFDASFDSAELAPSEGFSWFFEHAGTFEYVCTLHVWMTGTVVVGDGIEAALVSEAEPAPAMEEAPAEDPQ